MNEKLLGAAISYNWGDPKRIQHLIKVYQLAHYIAVCEGLDEKTLKTIEAAAILHDIGIRDGERLYGRCDGKIQEQLGPDIAKAIMKQVGGYDDVADRAAQLIGHHHTYTDIDGIDLQILIEADFLVNLFEDGCTKEAVKTAAEKMFVTNTGKELVRTMFGLE